MLNHNLFKILVFFCIFASCSAVTLAQESSGDDKQKLQVDDPQEAEEQETENEVSVFQGEEVRISFNNYELKDLFVAIFEDGRLETLNKINEELFDTYIDKCSACTAFFKKLSRTSSKVLDRQIKKTEKDVGLLKAKWKETLHLAEDATDEEMLAAEKELDPNSDDFELIQKIKKRLSRLQTDVKEREPNISVVQGSIDLGRRFSESLHAEKILEPLDIYMNAITTHEGLTQGEKEYFELFGYYLNQPMEPVRKELKKKIQAGQIVLPKKPENELNFSS
ncbi:MAG: hypothetical protein H6619_01550 [Deltaproteobacteria bacterium]|nr:hypothetical protein [Deltaproteobacteria bacterium]